MRVVLHKKHLTQRRWRKWKQSLPLVEVVPRSIAGYQEPLETVELHGFGDASKQGVEAAVYAVVWQPSGITQRLVVAKSRLAKQGLSIPRLEHGDQSCYEYKESSRGLAYL